MRITLEETAILLNHGGVAAVPTETVYGLAASLSNPEAIQQIYSIKGRPSNNPLIIHLSQIAQIEPYVTQFLPDFQRLAKGFWPGPLTLILPVDQSKVPSIARAHLPTAAFRVPSHPLISRLLDLTGPLVMPSANLSGSPSSTCVTHIEQDFGLNFPVLDGGVCRHGLESTILTFHQERWWIVRQGAISDQSLFEVLGYLPEIVKSTPEKPLCPGQLYRHYSPRAKLHLLYSIPSHFQGTLIGFSDRNYPSNLRLISLGPLSFPEKIAENLYAVLRCLDEEQISEAFVDMNFPQEGILATVAERLHRASS